MSWPRGNREHSPEGGPRRFGGSIARENGLLEERWADGIPLVMQVLRRRNVTHMVLHDDRSREALVAKKRSGRHLTSRSANSGDSAEKLDAEMLQYS